jgi:protein-tyrosine-phosphatase
VKVLFVCAGNTCRSPFAEALARRLAAERDLEIEFASAGETAREGDRCLPDALAAGEEHGVDLSAHRARRFTAEQAAPDQRVIRLYDVPDPMNQGLEAYRLTCRRLREKVEGLLAEVGA